jgi:glycosyltransferase involved in cell wall biosynthesis
VKIALLAPTFSKFSGVDHVVKQQASRLAQSGETVTIFAFEADLAPPNNVQLQILGMPQNLFWQRVYRLVFPLDIVKALKWVPKLREFDVIYSHQYPMNWIAYLAKRFYGIKYIYYNHAIAPPEAFSSLIERIYIRLISFLANWTIRKADEAISISRYLQQQLKKETGLDSEVVYNKIDTQRFYQGIDRSAVRDKHQLGNAPLVLYVGRISPHKGIHLLIEAFSLVRRQIPRAKLLVVGKHTFPSYSRKIGGMADNSVIFAGYVPDEELPSYYAACDVYATATMWEGFNLPLVEAQACGKPVVAFNLGPHPEVIKDKATGLLIPPADTAAFAEAIVKLLKDTKLRQEMGEKAYKAVRERFSTYQGAVAK